MALGESSKLCSLLTDKGNAAKISYVLSTYIIILYCLCAVWFTPVFHSGLARPCGYESAAPDISSVHSAQFDNGKPPTVTSNRSFYTEDYSDSSRCRFASSHATMSVGSRTVTPTNKHTWLLGASTNSAPMDKAAPFIAV